MKIELEKPNPPIDPKEIEIFESKTGYILPDDYKEFLLKQNGGLIKDKDENGSFCHKTVFDDGEVYYNYIQRFYELGFGDGTYFIIKNDDSTIDNVYSYDEFGNYGTHLAIGKDGDSNTISISLNKDRDDYGAIYIFQVYDLFYDEPEKACAKISNSFTEFMNTFVYYKDE